MPIVLVSSACTTLQAFTLGKNKYKWLKENFFF